jgi:cell shape-determining protein MreD
VTGTRAAAAVAASLTALLLQGALIGPVSVPWPVSLPAVLVAATALSTAPATGMVLGFGTGLLADLAGDGTVGALALTWLLLGIAAGTIGGLVRSGRGLAGQAVTVGALCTAATLGAVALDLALHPATRTDAGPVALSALAAGGVETALALAVLPLVGAVLRSPALRDAPVLGPDAR